MKFRVIPLIVSDNTYRTLCRPRPGMDGMRSVERASVLAQRLLADGIVRQQEADMDLPLPPAYHQTQVGSSAAAYSLDPDALRSRRLMGGFKPSEVAGRLGISVTLIYHWEKGSKRVHHRYHDRLNAMLPPLVEGLDGPIVA